MNITNSERRTHQRYLASTLSISLKPSKPSEKRRPDSHLCIIDFNRFGMAIQSEYPFKVGEKLHLMISDEYEQIIDVSCCVCNRAKTTDAYRYGLHFVEQHETDKKTKQSLVSMEQQLEESLY